MRLDPEELVSTHLKVWDALFKIHTIKTVLEFGCGLYSTKKFVDHGCEVTSIEQDYEPWFTKVSRDFPSANVILSIGPDEWKSLKLADKYDAVFIDGTKDARSDALSWARDHTDLIVAHDTEHDYWKYPDMSEFIRTHHDAVIPNTTVWERK